MTADDWMEEALAQVHGSPVPAQDFVLVDEGDGKILTKTEIQTTVSKGASWSRMSFRIDLVDAFNQVIELVGTPAKVYGLYCIGVGKGDLLADAHKKWPDAPRTESQLDKALQRGRGEWTAKLEAAELFVCPEDKENQNEDYDRD